MQIGKRGAGYVVPGEVGFCRLATESEQEGSA